jgi:hypothetical protein
MNSDSIDTNTKDNICLILNIGILLSNPYICSLLKAGFLTPTKLVDHANSIHTSDADKLIKAVIYGKLLELKIKAEHPKWQKAGKCEFFRFLPDGIKKIQTALQDLKPHATYSDLDLGQLHTFEDKLFDILIIKIQPYQGKGERKDDTIQFYEEGYILVKELINARLNHSKAISSLFFREEYTMRANAHELSLAARNRDCHGTDDSSPFTMLPDELLLQILKYARPDNIDEEAANNIAEQSFRSLIR